jgi:hypothetical protein
VHWVFDAFAVNEAGEIDLTQNVGGVRLGLDIANDITTNDITTNDITTNDITTNDITTNDITTNDITTNDITTNGLTAAAAGPRLP